MIDPMVIEIEAWLRERRRPQPPYPGPGLWIFVACLLLGGLLIAAVQHG